MANKAISELPQAQNVNNQDLFVLEQSGIAKKLPAETFITEQGIINALAEALDGHGGIQSVTLSSVSGRIRTYRITFTDQSATTFQVYDGTSIDRISRTSSSGLDDVYTIFLSDGTTTFFTVHNGADGDVSEAMLNDALKEKAPAVTETTESSAIANFTDGADDLVMHNIVAEINPVQSGSGDPSPSNIRPISGWTGCNVTRTGKNLCDAETELGGRGAVEQSDGSWYFASLENIDPNTIIWKCPSGYTGQVTISYLYKNANGSGSQGGRFKWVYSDGTTVTLYANVTAEYAQFTNTSASGKTVVGLSWDFGTAVNSTWFKDFQVELGSTATAYEPYQGETVTVDWSTEAGTVYGGTIDVATGLLTVEYARYKFTGTESLYAQVSSSQVAIKTGMVWKSTETGWCSDFKFHATAATNFFYLDTTMPAEDVKTYMANHDVYAVGVLATPQQTYQLTPQEVKTLLGTNNVWADTGNVTVTYPADTKMYIEKLTIPSEDDLVANQAITSGKYFMIGNSLYLALANIASGAQITIGTNAQRVSLADALNTINS